VNSSIETQPGGSVASVRARIHCLAVRDHAAALLVDAQAGAFLGMEIQQAMDAAAADLKAVADMAVAYWDAQAKLHHGDWE